MSTKGGARASLAVLLGGLLALCSLLPLSQEVVVLVARRHVPPWVLIREPTDYFEARRVPAARAPGRALRHFSSLHEQRLNRPLAAGEYVTTDDLLTWEQLGFLNGQRRPFRRTVEIKFPPGELPSGVIRGARIDVVFVPPPGSNRPAGRVLLTNIEVLEASDGLEQQVGPLRPARIRIPATPEQSTRIALASAIGELQLRPRSPE
jgi:Flp pilus assembly protein CpaB